MLLSLLQSESAAAEFEGTLVLSIAPTLNIDGDIGVTGALAASVTPALNLDGDIGVQGDLELSLAPALNLDGDHGVVGALALSITPTANIDGEHAVPIEGELELTLAPVLNLDGDVGVQGAFSLTAAASALDLDGEHGVSGTLAAALSPVLAFEGTASAPAVTAVGPAKRWWETLQPRERERERRREERRQRPRPIQGTLQLEIQPTLTLGIVTLHEGAIGLQLGKPQLKMAGEVLEGSTFDAYTRQRREDEELLWIWAA